MAGQRGLARASLRRTLPLVLIVLGLATTTWGLGAPFASATDAPGPAAAAATHATPPLPAGPQTSAEANVTFAPVYASTGIAPASANSTPCQAAGTYFILKVCAPETQNPSLVPLHNGQLGLGYSEYTTSGALCNTTANSTLASWTVSNVAWADSASNGSTWSAPTLLGTPSCRWPSASEPTFAAGPGNDVFGAYIVSNASVNASSAGTPQPFFPPDWGNASAGALVFVHSSDNGSVWSTPSVVSGATAPVEPRIAVSGRTIYIVYVNANNSTAIYPAGIGANYTNYPALSVSLVVSTNGGSTWGSPIVLPGLNASMGYWTSSPSVAVSAGGALAVAYATDRSCVATCRATYYSYPTFADRIVVATSTNNGSTWAGPTPVGPWIGECYASSGGIAWYSDAYSPNGYAFPWLSTPQTSLAYAPTGSTLYAAYAGTYAKVNASSSYSYLNWQDPGVFASVSANGGSTWVNDTVAANNSTGDNDEYFAPAVGVHGTTPYIAYAELNGSYCYSLSGGCPGFTGTASSWIANSTNGANWTSTLAGLSYYGTPTYTALDYLGYESSVAFTPGGSPVAAATLAGSATSGFGAGGPPYVYLQDYWTNLTISYRYSGPTTTVDFVEHNLTAGQSWGIEIGTQAITTNRSSIRLSGVPEGVSLPLAILGKTVSAYATTFTTSLSVTSPYEFSGPTTVDVDYTIDYGVSLWIEPTLTTFDNEMVSLFYGGTFYFIEAINGYVYNTAFPWMFPANVPIDFTVSGDPPFSYWNGTGLGSFTGAASTLNLTLGGPVNETGWAGSYGVYTETFSANDLPSPSVYAFTFNGTGHASPASAWTNVSGVSTGGYSVSNVTANASAAGWEYFGRPSTGSSTVVVPAEPTVVFDFALVDLAAAAGTVTFHASGLPNGTVWSVAFNGTDYSAATPWLNVTTRPGTFPWSVGPAVAADESAGFAPAPTNATVSVVAGQTVGVDYVPAYDVDVLSGLGGAVTGAGTHWVAVGGTATFVATPGSDYGFVGWTGSGPGSYTGPDLIANVTVGGAITESAGFYPLPAARFNMTFEETGVPAGTPWAVFVNGVGYGANTTALTVPGLLSCGAGTRGQYTEAVGIAFNASVGSVRYLPVDAPTEFCTNGGTVQPIAFVPQYEVRVSATLGGTAAIADGNVVSSSALWAYATDTLQLTATASDGDLFVGWTGAGIGSYTGPAASTDVTAGGPVTELATFAALPPPRHPTYTEAFTASPAVPTGTTWTLTIGGATYAAVGAGLNVSGLSPQTYTATVGVATSAAGTARWAPTPATISVAVTGDGSQTVAFGTPEFWVAIAGSAGGSVTPSSGWFGQGASVALGATPNPGWTFGNWSGSGTDAYSGNQSGPSVLVQGPFSEFTTFRPPVSTTTTTAASVWANPGTWAILAVVGLLAGLVVGVAVRRLGRTPPSDGATGGSG